MDFSDKLRNTRRKGFYFTSVEMFLSFSVPGYSVVWSGEDTKEEEETPVKKYKRLNCEVKCV